MARDVVLTQEKMGKYGEKYIVYLDKMEKKKYEE